MTAEKETRVHEEIVVLKRVYKNKRLPVETLEKSKMRFGVFSKGDRMIMPVSIDDKKIGERLYAELCNFTPNTQGWRETVNDWLLSMRIDVPHDGLPLNITLNKDGYPYNADHYIQWLIAKSHIDYKTGLIHENEQEAMKHPLGMFYVEDLRKIKYEKVLSVEDTAEAMVKLQLLFKEGKDKIDWILSFFGRNPFIMTDADKKIALNEIINGQAPVKPTVKISGTGEVAYINRPAKVFSHICDDERLEYKAMFETLENKGIITSIGGKYLYGDIELGLGIDDSISRVSGTSAESKKILLQLKAKYEELKREMTK